ncbi:MAG TPA: ParA family protein [Candidatus Omnitrophota bacterium]|nr:ParA family protein [Candidatus Omnitrophota bacterium]
MLKTYVFCNQKGGVGKTTSAVNVAAAVALKKNKVLLIDLDPQGNATSGLGIDKTNLKETVYNALSGEKKLRDIIVKSAVDNLYIAPANADLTGAEVELVDEMGREFVLKRLLEELAVENSNESVFDFVFIDSPPSLGILTLNALVAAQKIIVPVQCEYYALEGLGQLLKTIQLVKDRLNKDLDVSGVILTMADFRTKLTSEVIQEVKNYFGEKVYSTVIPRSVKLSEAPSFGTPGILYDAESRGTKGYLSLAEEFIKKESPNQISEEAKEGPFDAPLPATQAENLANAGN